MTTNNESNRDLSFKLASRCRNDVSDAFDTFYSFYADSFANSLWHVDAATEDAAAASDDSDGESDEVRN